MEKPPYRIPDMKEIAAIPWNGINVVSTFSGCGGSCLGYRIAGCKVVWASEFVPAAAEVYKLNHPNSHLDTRDIREVESSDILRDAGIPKGSVDILDGSPPCSSFSLASAGKRTKDWGKVKKYSDTKQRTDDLFFEYTRILDGLQPRAFVAENVPALIRGKAKGYFKQIIGELKDCGYKVSAAIINAGRLGVPQARQRLIFVGFRNDLGLSPVFPRPDSWGYTIGESLKGLDTSVQCIRFTGRGWGVGAPIYTPSFQSPTVTTMGFFSDVYKVDRPSSINCFSENQKNSDRLTIHELKRLCSFPDDFELSGSYEQRWERLGRAVPPMMMSRIASTIAEKLNAKR